MVQQLCCQEDEMMSRNVDYTGYNFLKFKHYEEMHTVPNQVGFRTRETYYQVLNGVISL